MCCVVVGTVMRCYVMLCYALICPVLCCVGVDVLLCGYVGCVVWILFCDVTMLFGACMFDVHVVSVLLMRILFDIVLL